MRNASNAGPVGDWNLWQIKVDGRGQVSGKGSRVAVVREDTIRVMELGSHEVSAVALRPDDVRRLGIPWDIAWAPSGAPASLLNLLGASLIGAGLFTAREYGAAMIGTLLLAWFARDVQARGARGAILVDLLVYDAIGVVITLAVVVSGVLNGLGWGIVVVYAFFTAGAGYLLLKEKPFKASHAQNAA